MCQQPLPEILILFAAATRDLQAREMSIVKSTDFAHAFLQVHTLPERTACLIQDTK